MVKYQLIYKEHFTFLNWIGKYTYGSCTIRGTCLHFQPSSAKFFHDLNNLPEVNIINDCNDCNNYIDKNTDITQDGIFLTEYCSYRCYNLSEAINALNIKPIDDIVNKENATNDAICMTYNKYFSDNQYEIKGLQGYYELENEKIIYFFKYNKIMNELKKINQYIKSNKVFQEWV